LAEREGFEPSVRFPLSLTRDDAQSCHTAIGAGAVETS